MNERKFKCYRCKGETIHEPMPGTDMYPAGWVICEVMIDGEMRKVYICSECTQKTVCRKIKK
jgi:hypothetical protein